MTLHRFPMKKGKTLTADGAKTVNEEADADRSGPLHPGKVLRIPGARAGA